MSNNEGRMQEFMRVRKDFHLGVLVTESRHPSTMNLSEQARLRPQEAVTTVKDIDLATLDTLSRKAEEVAFLSERIRETFAAGNRLFLCGCGATGRLSLSLETLWIEANPDSPLRNSVISFMAGGDVAIIKSIEQFEDRPDFGARQLEELGFRDGDLLVSCTEGGETPFVIGATERAAQISHRNPFFLYCNPDHLLTRHVERSRRVIENRRIQKINLTVGPMAISGSTRMQASTILMYAVGLALFGQRDGNGVGELTGRVHSFREQYAALDTSFLAKYIERESAVYQENNRVIYSTDAYGITVLTDTTERSPTFSLAAFENLADDARVPSLCYLGLPHAETVDSAWEIILGRAPRALNWEGLTHLAGPERLRGFDVSRNAFTHRKASLPDCNHHEFSINRRAGRMSFRFQDLATDIPVGNLPLLEEHILLKMLMNTHSTLVMGRLGRYHGNIMTWVRPSNFKLIDRSIRYVQHLLSEAGISRFQYEEIAEECMTVVDTLGPNEPLVLKVFDALRRRAG